MPVKKMYVFVDGGKMPENAKNVIFVYLDGSCRFEWYTYKKVDWRSLRFPYRILREDSHKKVFLGGLTTRRGGGDW